MAQDPRDPRIAEYYTRQRQADTIKASGGDAKARAELNKIVSKLPQSRRAAAAPSEVLQGKPLGTSPLNPLDDPVTFAADLPAAAVGGARLGATLIGRGISKGADALSHLVPRAAEDLAHDVGSIFPRTKPRVSARIERPQLPKPRGEAPKNVTPKGPKALKPGSGKSTGHMGEFARKAAAKAKQSGGKIKGAFARRGSRGSETVAARGEQRVALNPGKATRAESAQAKLDQASKGVRAPAQARAKPSTPRAKGTNPRAKMESGPSGTRQGVNPRSKGTNPRARKK